MFPRSMLMMTTLAQNANQSTSDRRSRAMGSYVTPTLVIIAVLLAAAPGSAQTFTTLYTFPGGTDSSRPNAVIRTASGVLVGTAWAGGAYGFGTVFRVNPNGKETVVYS